MAPSLPTSFTVRISCFTVPRGTDRTKETFSDIYLNCILLLVRPWSMTNAHRPFEAQRRQECLCYFTFRFRSFSGREGAGGACRRREHRGRGGGRSTRRRSSAA